MKREKRIFWLQGRHSKTSNTKPVSWKQNKKALQKTRWQTPFVPSHQKNKKQRGNKPLLFTATKWHDRTIAGGFLTPSPEHECSPVHLNSDRRVKAGFWGCTRRREGSLYQDVSSVKKESKFTTTPEEGFTTGGPNAEGKGSFWYKERQARTNTSTSASTEDGKKVTSLSRQKNGFGAGNGANGAYGSWERRNPMLQQLAGVT